jgi:hypothetical protein
MVYWVIRVKDYVWVIRVNDHIYSDKDLGYGF